MIPENIQRIDQIRRGEVPDGYKKTKVGIVPVEWREIRFNQLFSRLNRKNTEGNTNVLTISAQYGLVNQEEFFNKSVASDDKSNYYLLNRGEFAYNKSYSNGYPFGAIKRLDKYEKGVVSPLYICFSGSEENKCPDFYLQYFEAGKMNSEIKAFAQEGARNHGLLNISVDVFFNSILVAPPISEQKKIAEILSLQDRMIELYEKKAEQLKKLKKVFLQKMFPKPGASAPEWRFPGFTDAWEQRKLEDYLIVSDEKNKNNIYTKNDVFSVSGDYGVVNQIEFQGRSFAGSTVDNYGIVYTGDVVYTKSPLKTTPYGIIKANKLNTGIVSVLYAVYHPLENCNSNFVQTYFEQDARLNNYLRPLISKGAKNTINVSDEAALKGDVVFPSVDEQTVISIYFSKIDNLITLHQRKCEEEKQKKKALMQLLLTGIVRVKE